MGDIVLMLQLPDAKVMRSARLPRQIAFGVQQLFLISDWVADMEPSGIAGLLSCGTAVGLRVRMG